MDRVTLAGTALLGLAMLFQAQPSEYHLAMPMLIALTGALFVAAMQGQPLVAAAKAGAK
jgi:hypothetical protein